jgi:hypothetical protein
MKIRALFRGMFFSVAKIRNQFQYSDTLKILPGPLAEIRQRISGPVQASDPACESLRFFLEGLAKFRERKSNRT